MMSPRSTGEDAAWCFVNPPTALGMVETMRREGHMGLVHTVASLNLGQILAAVEAAANRDAKTFSRYGQSLRFNGA